MVGAGDYQLSNDDIFAWQYENWGDAPPVPTPSIKNPELILADVLVDFGDGVHWNWEDVTLDSAQSHTANDALILACQQLGFALEATTSEYGVFIDGINDVFNAADWSTFWMFELWNTTGRAWEAASTGVDSYNISKDDVIALFNGAWGELPRPTPLERFPDPSPKPGYISGHVENKWTGLNVTGAWVRVYSNETLANLTSTDEHGNFITGPLAPGNYILNVSLVNYQHWLSGPIEVSIRQTTIINETITLVDYLPPPTTAVTATNLHAAEGDTIELNWTGYLEPNDLDEYWVFMSTTSFEALEGLTPTVTVTAGTQSKVITGLTPDTTYYFAVVTVDKAGNYWPSATPVTVTPTTPLPSIFTLTIGRIIDEDGNPIENAQVIILLGNESFTNSTSADGKVTFAAVPDTWKGQSIDIKIEKDGYHSLIVGKAPITEAGAIITLDIELKTEKTLPEGNTWWIVIAVIVILVIVLITAIIIKKRR